MRGTPRYGGEGMEGERKSKGERGQGTGRWHTRGGRVVAAIAAYRPMAASIATPGRTRTSWGCRSSASHSFFTRPSQQNKNNLSLSHRRADCE